MTLSGQLPACPATLNQAFRLWLLDLELWSASESLERAAQLRQSNDMRQGRRECTRALQSQRNAVQLLGNARWLPLEPRTAALEQLARFEARLAGLPDLLSR